MQISLTINGIQRTLQVAPQTTLLGLLREHAGLTGTKESCGAGVCGACTVLLDGQPISSCLFLAAFADGHRVTTVEGLAPAGQVSAVQTAFMEQGASQCGFCTPGMVVTTTALLERHPHCSEREAKEYLSGNLCRCGSYYQILAAIESLQAD